MDTFVFLIAICFFSEIMDLQKKIHIVHSGMINCNHKEVLKYFSQSRAFRPSYWVSESSCMVQRFVIHLFSSWLK